MPSAAASTYTPEPLSSESMLHGATVLIVDEEMGPRQALRMLLKEDYEVHLADSVATAQAVLAETLVDLVITDLRMPGQSGIDLVRFLNREYPDVEVIILTGYGQLETAVAAIDCGVSAYLEKPFDAAALLARVRGALAHRQRTSEERSIQRLALEANRFETMGRLLSGTVHDLGTPLSVLGSHIELMMSSPRFEEQRQRLESMLSQVRHCNDLVRTTMNFLRHAPTERTLFTLNAAVGSCLDVARPLLMRGHVALFVDLDPGLRPCTGDIIMVRQALLNLITNACQAMEKNQGPQELYIRTWNEPQSVCVSVRDSGPGIPAEHRPHIFEALYTTRPGQGTGLGLAVVQHVMLAHGGMAALVMDTVPGACFVLRFPSEGTQF